MLIKRVYEIDPLSCPACGGRMRAIAFIEPPQAGVIEKILRYRGLWHPAASRVPPAGEILVHGLDGALHCRTASSDEPREVAYVGTDTCWAPFWFSPESVSRRRCARTLKSSAVWGLIGRPDLRRTLPNLDLPIFPGTLNPGVRNQISYQ